MLDTERVDELLKAISDKYTAEEVCEILGLDVWDILEMFREQVLEKEDDFEL